jgi:hydroxymethylglutaryl-CoA synthase
MAHAYDFYKPNLNSPYPVVDGQLSVQCYASALDTCYTQYCTKSQMNHESHSHTHTTTLTSREVNLSTFAAVLFHSPYVKLVQKSLARLYLNDLIRACPYIPSTMTEKYKNLDIRTLVNDKDLEREMVEQSKELYEQKTLPGLYFSQNMGNMYTPSLYYSLFAFLISQPNEEQLYGRRILLFSYGSGLASSMYSVVCRKVHECRFTLAQLQRSIQRARHRLDHERMEITPDLMDKVLLEREESQHKVPFIPKQPNEMLKSGDMYLKSIDANYRRSYDKFIANDNSEGDNNNIQQLYTEYFQTRQTSGDA